MRTPVRAKERTRPATKVWLRHAHERHPIGRPHEGSESLAEDIGRHAGDPAPVPHGQRGRRARPVRRSEQRVESLHRVPRSEIDDPREHVGRLIRNEVAGIDADDGPHFVRMFDGERADDHASERMPDGDDRRYVDLIEQGSQVAGEWNRTVPVRGRARASVTPDIDSQNAVSADEMR